MAVCGDESKTRNEVGYRVKKYRKKHKREENNDDKKDTREHTQFTQNE